MKKLLKLFLFFAILTTSMLTACTVGTSTFTWYDADGTLLKKETVPVWQEHSTCELPADTEQWDYTDWSEIIENKSGSKKTYTACRIPKKDYFVGNVFQIIVQDLGRTPVATGSAFVFNENGWFITNAHVMEGAYYAQGIFNIPNEEEGESFTYCEIDEGSYYHADKDIYIGKIKDYSAVKPFYKEISLNTTYEEDDITYSVGYPLSATELQINEGVIVENWGDLYDKLYGGISYVCSSSYIAPGSSGGILVNSDLEVLGITTLGKVSDDNEERFISGAAISAFNFQNLIKSPDPTALISLVERFHSTEMSYINLFNAMRDGEYEGCEYELTEEGIVSYKYEESEEYVNSDNEALLEKDFLVVCADGYMECTIEIYWEGGSSVSFSLFGNYLEKMTIDNLWFLFEYRWGDGNAYAVYSDKINYSQNVALTLNKYYIDDMSTGYEPTADNIIYAKERFNLIYELVAAILEIDI